jgi:ribosomal protein L40E
MAGIYVKFCLCCNAQNSLENERCQICNSARLKVRKIFIPKKIMEENRND